MQSNHNYSLDICGNKSTVLNHALDAFAGCNVLLQKKPGDDKAIIAKELSAEILMLMANSPIMTDNVVKKTGLVVSWFCNPEAKLPEVYKTVLEDHPMWSIYNCTALIDALDPDTKVLNRANFERYISYINAKKDITDTLNCPKSILEIVTGYAFESDVELAAAYHQDQITSELIGKELEG